MTRPGMGPMGPWVLTRGLAGIITRELVDLIRGFQFPGQVCWGGECLERADTAFSGHSPPFFDGNFGGSRGLGTSLTRDGSDGSEGPDPGFGRDNTMGDHGPDPRPTGTGPRVRPERTRPKVPVISRDFWRKSSTSVSP